MSQARVAVAPQHEQHDLDVQHIWMHDRRSLCDLAHQVAAADGVSAGIINDRASDGPVCGPCIEVSDMLARRLQRMLAANGSRRSADFASSMRELTQTRWPWMVSDLRKDHR